MKAEIKPANFKEGHNPEKPPAVAIDKKPVWHDPYTYKNTKGTEILVKGHWEIINKPKPKPAATEATVEEIPETVSEEKTEKSKK